MQLLAPEVIDIAICKLSATVCAKPNSFQGSYGIASMQGLRQDLETGCPKLAIAKFLGIQIFKGDHNILRLQLLTYMYEFMKIRHNILIQCHGNHVEMKNEKIK